MADEEKRKHKVSIVVEGRQVESWLDYQIESSLIVPADRFAMRRAFQAEAWNAIPLDARVRVYIDATQVLDGFIDRKRKTHGHEFEISGVDRGGRLLQESAPSINYQGLELSEAIRRLSDPWFTEVALSDARNRKLRTGKGFKVAGGAEPIYIHKTVKRAGYVHPGQTRWQAIQEIASQAELAVWSSADGRSIFVGQPNQQQQAQFVVALAKEGSRTTTTVKSLEYEEDIGDGFSVIAVVGTGGGTEQDFGESVASRHGAVFDFPSPDGTGGDFRYPKRLLMPEKQFDSNDDALSIAKREQARRNFRRRMATAIMPLHGQFSSIVAPTIFAPNTMAHVVDEEFEPALRGDFLIYGCSYTGNRHEGETTTLEMVPRGTELVL